MAHSRPSALRQARFAAAAMLACASSVSAAVASDPWIEVGAGSPGSAGVPHLGAEGSLIGQTNYTLELTNAAPNSPAFLILGSSQVHLPVAGGVLVPSLDAIVGPLSTDSSGAFTGNAVWPASLAPGVNNYWQFWVADGGAPGGWSSSNGLESTTPEQVGGSFPEDWIHGGDCATDPLIQVHQYNDDTYILRQSMCSNFEGPFMYLLFGEDEVLLQDTGAGGIPIAATVYGIIDDWLTENGKTSIELLVTHSHSHGDHVQGDNQFLGQPNTTVVGTSQAEVANFFGIAPWPTDIESRDLGGRVLDVLAIPGHHQSHVALYDRNTGLLLTGDSLYPGFIFLSSTFWNLYRTSISRLRDFVEELPVAWVLGTHIEMKSTPFEAYPYGTNNQPDERILQLELKHLRELDDALDLLPSATTEVHADFIING